MVNFVIQHIPEFTTRQRVNKLLRNGRCMLDEFWTEIRGDNNLAPELDELVATLEDVANGKWVPLNQYKKLHVSNKLRFAPFEAKSKHLRLYLFHERETGQILIIDGKKGDQDEDIKRVERIIKEYTMFKQTQTK
ncbi:MAG TPA: hypothetical protein VI731_07740 [Bacteroidia bacterium]|nr:hypothetical protein [Bacteroidia bacterium]